MAPEILKYNDSQESGDRDICNVLAEEIDLRRWLKKSNGIIRMLFRRKGKLERLK